MELIKISGLEVIMVTMEIHTNHLIIRIKICLKYSILTLVAMVQV
jgi:hypothetical protein